MINLFKFNIASWSDDLIFKRLNDPCIVKFKIVTDGKESRRATGITREISVYGMCLESSIVRIDDMHISQDNSMSKKNKLYMEIELPNHTTIKISGEACWYSLSSNNDNIYKYKIGIKFFTDDEDALNRLRELFNEKIEKHISQDVKIAA